MGEQFKKFKNRYPELHSILDATALAPGFDQKKTQFKEFYATQYPVLRAAEKTLRNLIELLLDHEDIESPKVLSRIKSRDESIAKFELKYRNEVEKTGEDYEIKSFITDLIGLRVICLYETDIEIVKRAIERNFVVLEITDKTKLLTADVDSFGYKGLHIDVRLGDDRKDFTEYKNFSGLQFEIQIRSIVQDAWSEVDHKLKYKKQIPDSLKRRIFRLSALFELADQEFCAIRQETTLLEKAATDADSNTVSTEPSILDSFSFLALMRSLHPGYTFGPEKIDGFVDELKQMKPDLTTAELSDAIEKHLSDVRDYKDHLLSTQGFRINPFTEMRHVLFLYKNSVFREALYPRQGNELLDWYNARQKPSKKSRGSSEPVE